MHDKAQGVCKEFQYLIHLAIQNLWAEIIVSLPKGNYLKSMSLITGKDLEDKEYYCLVCFFVVERYVCTVTVPRLFNFNHYMTQILSTLRIFFFFFFFFCM